MEYIYSLRRLVRRSSITSVVCCQLDMVISMKTTSAILSAVLVHGGDGLTATALNTGALGALRLARQYDWLPDETRRFSVVVTCRGAKHSLSYLVTFGYPK